MTTPILKTMERYAVRCAHRVCTKLQAFAWRPTAALAMAMIVLAGTETRSALAFQGEESDHAPPYVAAFGGMTSVSYGWSRFPGFSSNDCCLTCRNAWDGYCQEKQEECYHHLGDGCSLRCRVAGWLHPACNTCSSKACDSEGCCDSEAETCDTCETEACCGHRCGGHLFRLFGLLGHGECCESHCDDGCCGDTCGEQAGIDGWDVDLSVPPEPPVPTAPDVPASDTSI